MKLNPVIIVIALTLVLGLTGVIVHLTAGV